MVAYSPHPVFVDGVRLDSAAWNVQTKARQVAASRAADMPITGVDGVAPSLNDDLDPTTLTLTMWVLGTDENGLVPAGETGMSQCLANLDVLSHLFVGKRHALLNVTQVVDNAGTLRQAWCKVVDAISPEVRAGGLGRFAVSLLVLDGMWQDGATSDWSQPSVTADTVYEVATLRGSSAPVSDTVVLVTGPVTNPQVNDFASSAYVRLNAVLASGQSWRVNVGTWTTRYGTLTLGSSDLSGTDGQAVTVFGGGNSRFLRLSPAVSDGLRRVRLSLSGSGMTSATSLAVRGRRKFLL